MMSNSMENTLKNYSYPNTNISHHSLLKQQLKAVLLLVTLISVYYHGLQAVISSSFLNPGSIVHAATGDVSDNEPNSFVSKDGVMIAISNHHHNVVDDHNRNQDEKDNDLIQASQRQHQLQQQHQNEQDDFRQQRQHIHYLIQKDSTTTSSASTTKFQQANDTLTKLQHSQGRIDEEAELDAGGGRGAVGGKSQMEKRYALFTKSRGGFKRVKQQQEGHIEKDKSATSTSPKLLPSDLGVTCKDEAGNSVSWFIAYKFPRVPSEVDPLVKDGSKYFYILPGASSWTSSALPIHDSSSILGKTMQIMWENTSVKANEDIAKIFYNDQPPSIPAIVMNGHTKGLILSSSKGGIWLQHSCPHFPDPKATNFTGSYPIGGHINGQMFFCLSFANTSVVDEIGSILEYTRPFVYNYSIPLTLASQLPRLKKVAEQNATVKNAPWMNTYEMDTLSLSANNEALHVKAYAKGPKFRKDVYSAWIAPDYGTSFDVQSWLNGPHPLLSNCTSNVFPVFNVLKKSLGGLNFSYTDDHSKWAVSTNTNKLVTCIGDLNRMKPQKTRGGVTICVTNEQVWTAFNSLVKQTQPCNSTSLRSFSVNIHPLKHSHNKKKSHYQQIQ